MKKLILIACAALLSSACKKEETPQPEPVFRSLETFLQTSDPYPIFTFTDETSGQVLADINRTGNQRAQPWTYFNQEIKPGNRYRIFLCSRQGSGGQAYARAYAMIDGDSLSDQIVQQQLMDTAAVVDFVFTVR